MKRGREEDSDGDQSFMSSPLSICRVFTLENFSQSISTKRLQIHQIHTDVHHKTVEMMMNAQLRLQREEEEQKHRDGTNGQLTNSNLSSDPDSNSSSSSDPNSNSSSSTYYQKPYW
ncbi:hypothetical protein KGF56_003805 [Candida oxycetoniae]|uniref:Uncharacterized protein n=1 Tax=Candida oxycetoniae TaxID=497107 RepID=A0AAI9WWX3_9ASCO|nr:uncharacterized protein KGF56_003805 [Candida oxycetoniae]KAI3403384.2 hypothetical protein KGF56_003805 [Candida oxycetoniae]